MNPSKFDQVVKNRASERVKSRVETFRKDVGLAILKLTDGRVSPPNYHDYWNTESAAAIFAGLKTNQWPAQLWEKEEEKVLSELLATMDEMAKALIAPAPSADGPQPIPETAPSK